MPGMDGFETLEESRKEHSLPILMFTSKNDSISKVRGLSLIHIYRKESIKDGGAFGKLLILSFEDNEEHIINNILSCLNEETEVLRQQIVNKRKLIFEGPVSYTHLPLIM